jgi:Xaa-Pro aminopeptidase
VWESYDWSALEGVPPISRDEFLARQDELAEVLRREEVDAFIAEPGGTSQYYVNVSSSVWELSERPFLLVVTPVDIFFLAPLFEVSRAKMLNIVSNETKFVTWAEGTPILICY